MALAGFTRSEIEIVTERDTLHVTGRKQKDDVQRTYLHRGIAAARFRTALPAGQPREGHQRRLRQRHADHRTGARSARSAQAAQDRDRRRERQTDNVQVLEQPQQQLRNRSSMLLMSIARTVDARAPAVRAPFLRPCARAGRCGKLKLKRASKSACAH